MMLDAPSSFRKPNGQWEHHIRQSDLERFGQCPDLHRRFLVGDVQKDREGDAALVGTAGHEVYRIAAQALVDPSGGTLYPAEQLCDLGVMVVDKLWGEAEENGTLSQMQIASLADAETDVINSVEVWCSEFYPLLANQPYLIQGIEHQFDIKIYEDLERVLFLSGTYDLKFDDEIQDYKHSRSQKYTKQKAWELSRYSKQPTHYTFADAIESGNSTEESKHYFSYVNINPEKKTLELVGEPEGLMPRTIADFEFHMQEMFSLATLIEADLPRWPLGASDWWCSSKWCPAWMDCRGKFLGEDPWQLLEKVEINLTKKRLKAVQ